MSDADDLVLARNEVDELRRRWTKVAAELQLEVSRYSDDLSPESDLQIDCKTTTSEDYFKSREHLVGYAVDSVTGDLD